MVLTMAKTFVGKDGKIHIRRPCSIDGCNSLRRVVKSWKWDFGIRYYHEQETCCKHSRKGIVFPYFSKNKWKEDNWKRQGIHLTVREYHRLFELQSGCCALCGIHQDELKKALFVDHCHSTGKIRGLLCHRCNTGISLVDRMKSLDELKRYLESDIVSRYGDIL